MQLLEESSLLHLLPSPAFDAHSSSLWHAYWHESSPMHAGERQLCPFEQSPSVLHESPRVSPQPSIVAAIAIMGIARARCRFVRVMSSLLRDAQGVLPNRQRSAAM